MSASTTNKNKWIDQIVSITFEALVYSSITIPLTTYIIYGEILKMNDVHIKELWYGFPLAVPLAIIARKFRKYIAEKKIQSEQSKRQVGLRFLFLLLIIIGCSFTLSFSLFKTSLANHWIHQMIGFILLFLFGSLIMKKDIESKRNLKKSKEKILWQFAEIKKKESDKRISEIKRKSLEIQQLDIVEGIKHELNNRLPVAKTTIRSMKKLVQQEPEKYHDLVPLIKELETKLDSSLMVINNMEDIMRKAKKASAPFDIFVFVEDFLSENSRSFFDQNVKIIHNQPEKDIFIHVAKDYFKILLEMLFENARRHSFNEENRTDYKLAIAYTISSEKIELAIMTNGTPFNCTNQEYLAKHSKSGSTGNSGFGGHAIKAVIESLNAEIDIEKDRNKSFPEIIREHGNFSDFRTITFDNQIIQP
jgi:anti-sigma regulatory factor (Ser/Thr protein kinase)